MDFKNTFDTVVRQKRENDNLACMFASVGIDDFIAGQFDDTGLFRADGVPGRTELFRQIVPADGFGRESFGQLSGGGTDLDLPPVFLCPDPDKRTSEQIDDFLTDE